MARKRDPLLGQAQDEALLRYGQPRETLADMLVSARRTRDQGLATSKGSLAGILAAIDQAAPEMRKVYADATGSIDAADQLLRTDLASLGSAADPFKAAGFRENAGAHQRLAEAGAMALSELSDRKVRSAEGAALQQSGIQGRYAESVGDIGNRAESLSREEGVFTASRYGQLREGRAKRKVDYARIRSQRENDRLNRELSQDRLDETKRHNQQTESGKGKNGKGKNGKPRYGPGSLTQDQENKYVTAVNDAAALIRQSPKKDDAGKPLTKAAIRAHLLNGTNPSKQKFAAFAVNAAMDLVYKTGLSPENVRRLHKMGVHVGGNWPTLKAPKPSGAGAYTKGPGRPD